MLAACGSSPPPTTAAPAPGPEPIAGMPAAMPVPAEPDAVIPVPMPGPAPSGPKPEIGAWGFDLAGMNTKVAPGRSFYQYANGAWLAATPIPADKSNYGMFTVLADKSEERTKEIILNASGPAGSEAKKIADYYKSFLDEAAIEKKGIAPIKADLAKIDK